MIGLLGYAALATVAFVDPSAPASAASAVIEVNAGKHDRVGTPVLVPLPESFALANVVSLVDVDTGVSIPAQVQEGPPRTALTILTLPAGASKRFRLESRANANPLESEIKIVEKQGRVTAQVGGKEVWTYQRATAHPPAGIDPVYRRSGFLHPLRTPSGRVVTNDFAPDHPHQHGVFFAWTNTAFRGKAMNFWDQLQKTARVESLPEFRAPTEERSAPSVSFALRHEDITAGEDRPATVLNERWVVTTYPRRSPYLVDLESIQVTASDDPLVINKYHYGGLGVRGNGVWSDPEAKGEDPPDPSRCGESEFLTSEGKTRADGNHTRPRWVDIHGEVDGAFAGLAVLQHPSNFRFPQPVRLHPNMPYFSVAPAVLGGFKIEPGTPYRSRYRLVIHDGKPDPRELDRLWNDYAEPPTVRVVEGDTP